jgi:hypothetical protein
MDLGRRDVFAGVLQALLLTLFPWLRTERGVHVVGEGAAILYDRATCSFEGNFQDDSYLYKLTTVDVTDDGRKVQMADPRWHFADGVVSWNFKPARRIRGVRGVRQTFSIGVRG